MEGKYDIPKNMSRKERRENLRELKKRVKRMKSKWDAMQTQSWWTNLSEEEMNKAVNFQHEDATVNKKVIEMAQLEKDIVYYVKLINKLEKHKKGNPVVHGNSKKVQTVRTGLRERYKYLQSAGLYTA